VRGRWVIQRNHHQLLNSILFKISYQLPTSDFQALSYCN
jgi:hypothetical protein